MCNVRVCVTVTVCVCVHMCVCVEDGLQSAAVNNLVGRQAAAGGIVHV